MADIDIEEKNTPIWPWIVAAIVVILVLFLFVFDDDDDDNYEMTETTTTQTIDDDYSNDISEMSENVQAVQAFVQFVNEGEGRMGIEHEYTHQALMQLVDATQAMADAIDFNIDAQMAEANEMAQIVLTEPYSNIHANKISIAFMEVSTALENMQEEYYPNLANEVSALRQMASDLDPDVLTLDQKDAVTSYFNQAADILSSMN